MRTFCRLCEVGCGLVATVERGRLVRVRGDREHPATAGFACSKGLRAVEIHHDPDRVRAPQRRTDGAFAEVSWADATEEIASRVRELIELHGPRSVGIYVGNPNAFNPVGSAAAISFVSALGSNRMFSAATQDCTNKYAVAELVYGNANAQPIPDFGRTELLLVIGSNPRVSGSSFVSAANPVARLRQIRDRGGRVVFVNPLEIEPEIGETLQLRPDTDAYLLAALLHEIGRSRGFQPGRLEGRVLGQGEVEAFVAPYSPEAVAEVVGIPAERIAQLARDFADARGASVHASTGVNMGRQGALGYWLVQMLLLLTGNLDRAGGSYLAARGLANFSAPVDRSLGSFEPSPWGPYRRAVRMLPSALMAELIEDDTEPLRALFVVAGNPLLTVPGGRRLRDALASLELLVTVDLYRNATGELAHFVLPATDEFERADLNGFVQGIQSEPFVQWTAPVVEPSGEQRHEFRIFGDLMRALGKKPLLDPLEPDPLAKMFDGLLAPAGLSVAGLRDAGGVVEIPEPGPGDSFARRGISGEIVCVAEALRPTLERGHEIFEELRGERRGRFSLISRRRRDQMNSWFANLPARGSRPADNPLWMHPDDAAELALAAGARAQVENEYGRIETQVQHDARLRRGVVAMAHGFGNDSTTGMPNAKQNPGVNVNALTPSGPGSFDPVSCMAQTTGVPVEVRPLAPCAASSQSGSGSPMRS